MGVIAGFLGMIILALFIRWLGVEIGAHHKPLCRWLVKGAARRLPDTECAAAESEWLQVIEDLPSPTAQLLHSLSFAFSALQIRQEIAPQPENARLFRMVISFQAGMATSIIGTTFYTLLYHKEEVVTFVRQHDVTISKPAAIVLLFACGVASGVAAYANHRFMMWYFSRRARRRSSTTVE
jgi:hypothetical protein